jgi:YD repeat-containing protein
MKRLSLAALILLSLIGAAGAEERVETIEGAKGSKELVYREEILVESRSFDRQGYLLEETDFGPESLPSGSRLYNRSGGRLLGVDEKDASGELIGQRTYRYDLEGRLLGISSTGSLGEGGTGMLSAESGPKGSWSGNAATTVLSYDAKGRAVLAQTLKDGSVLSVERRSYRDDASLASIVVEDAVKKTRFEITYDESGRQAQRVDTAANKAVTKTSYAYDDRGRLVEEKSSKGGRVGLVSKVYAEDGKLAREETRQDGELVLAIDYIEGGRIEELYDEGELFVKASYLGGRKVKDVFFADGQAVRSREYK